jgi:alkyl sulfatase BDS1-like metallo-beta-lactamase superfamily hydrolase
VVKGGDAEEHLRKRFPHKRMRHVRSAARATTVQGFLFGMRLAFQPGQAKALDAVFHFDFTGPQAAKATVTIRDRKLTVEDGLLGTPALAITVDGASWLRFLAKDIGLPRLLLTRRLKLKGSPKLLLAFAKCFPG